MHSSEADEPGRAGWGLEELKLLAALGFGPDSALMTEPKLFVDGPFLAALQQEFASELDAEEAARTLYHIGVIHGLRDAARIGGADPTDAGVPRVVECPPVVMRFQPDADEAEPFQLRGTWPDAFEAEARLAKLGASDDPACVLSAGYTSGWLSGTLDRDICVEETQCRAADATCCSFVAREESAADAAHGPRRLLPVAALRAVALASPDAGHDARREANPLPQNDPEDPAVHIWGPVMVMPFTSPDAAMQTIEMLSLDDSSQAVRVVVVDLGGEPLDEGFGAAALERVVEEVQTWGAEVILTGISSASEDVVADLQASLMLARKDLAEAIAYAFQIADAQRHLL